MDDYTKHTILIEIDGESLYSIRSKYPTNYEVNLLNVILYIKFFRLSNFPFQQRQ